MSRRGVLPSGRPGTESPCAPVPHYPTCLATPGSCASPPAAALLAERSGTQSVQVAASPCWTKALPDGSAAPLSLRAWPPTPAALAVHGPVASPTTSAFPSCGPGRRSPKPVQRLPYGALCEAAVMPACSGPQVCSPPRSLLPLRPPRMAAVTSPSEPLVVCSLPPPRIGLPSASGH